MLFCSANLLKNIVILRANLYQEILIDTQDEFYESGKPEVMNI